MGHFDNEGYVDKEKKGKEEKENVIEESEEESALIMAIFHEYGEILLQVVSDSYDNATRVVITGKKSFFSLHW